MCPPLYRNENPIQKKKNLNKNRVILHFRKVLLETLSKRNRQVPYTFQTHQLTPAAYSWCENMSNFNLYSM